MFSPATLPGHGRFASSKAFSNPTSCSSSSWQSTVISQIRLSGSGSAWRAGLIAVSVRLCGGVQTVQQQWWAAADLAAAEPADRAVHAYRCGVLVELDHDAFDAA